MPTLDNILIGNYDLAGSGLKFESGGFILFAPSVTQITNNTSTRKRAYSFLMQFQGTYNIVFSLITSSSDITVNGQIYVNGTPRGKVWSASFTAASYAEDITVSAGDRIEIWIWVPAPSGSYSGVVYNPHIRCQNLLTFSTN
jgi:hypothetical protein